MRLKMKTDTIKKIMEEQKKIKEEHDNTILEKGSYFVLNGVKPSWSEMGLTEIEWNNDYGKNRPMVLNGKLYGYNDKPFEVVRCITEVCKDMTLTEVYEDFEDDWMWSPLYTKYGILSETIPNVIPISKRPT